MIDVSCALIIGRNNDILVTQRSGAMRLPFKWEFPGGKVEPGETAKDCIVREIKEELGLTIKVVKQLNAHIHHQEESTLRLIPFECVIISGEIVLTEHAQYLWLKANELKNLDWAAADLPVLHAYLSTL